jgi:hypothetical protein
MNQLTVRGFDEALRRRIREVAKSRGVSLNQAAVLLLKQGAGLAASADRRGKVGDALKKFSGRWSKDEEAEFLEAIRPLEKVDPSFWK